VGAVAVAVGILLLSISSQLSKQLPWTAVAATASVRGGEGSPPGTILSGGAWLWRARETLAGDCQRAAAALRCALRPGPQHHADVCNEGLKKIKKKLVHNASENHFADIQ